MIRTHPQWLAVKDLVASGRIGELRSMLGAFSYTNRDPANIRNRPEFGGGALMDIGCYLVNTSRFIFGREPLRVTGAIERDPDMRTDRLTSILLDFGTGHAAGTCSTQMVPYQQPANSWHDGPHRAADSLQRPTRPAQPHHRRHRCRSLWRWPVEYRRRHLQPVHNPGRSVLEGHSRRQRRALSARRRREEHGVYRCHFQIVGERTVGGTAVTCPSISASTPALRA